MSCICETPRFSAVDRRFCAGCGLRVLSAAPDRYWVGVDRAPRKLLSDADMAAHQREVSALTEKIAEQHRKLGVGSYHPVEDEKIAAACKGTLAYVYPEPYDDLDYIASRVRDMVGDPMHSDDACQALGWLLSDVDKLRGAALAKPEGVISEESIKANSVSISAERLFAAQGANAMARGNAAQNAQAELPKALSVRTVKSTGPIVAPATKWEADQAAQNAYNARQNQRGQEMALAGAGRAAMAFSEKVAASEALDKAAKRIAELEAKDKTLVHELTVALESLRAEEEGRKAAWRRANDLSDLLGTLETEAKIARDTIGRLYLRIERLERDAKRGRR